jgi:NADPH2:quinone reductase
MRAMIATRWGEPADLAYAETADPSAGPGEVLIETRAIGCNFPDILMVQGKYQVKPPLPFSPGHEVAGVVRAVGPGVTRVRPGQRVIGLLGWGAYAELVVAPAAHTFAIPDTLSFVDGAAFGLVYQTSYGALVHRAALRAGEWLLVHGAAGGVGLAAVQIGKALRARVIATAGTGAKLEVARQAGADVVIDYQTEDWVERVKAITDGAGADVIYDPVGGDVFDGSSKCIAFEGRLLVIGFAGGRIPSIAVNRVLLKNFSVVGMHWGLYQRRGSPLVDAWMDALWALHATGQVRPVVYRTYPLAEAARALRALAGRESYGKVVLVPDTVQGTARAHRDALPS